MQGNVVSIADYSSGYSAGWHERQHKHTNTKNRTCVLFVEIRVGMRNAAGTQLCRHVTQCEHLPAFIVHAHLNISCAMTEAAALASRAACYEVM